MQGLLAVSWATLGLALTFRPAAGVAELALALGALLPAGLSAAAAVRPRQPFAWRAAWLNLLSLIALLLTFSMVPPLVEPISGTSVVAGSLSPALAYGYLAALVISTLCAGYLLGGLRRAAVSSSAVAGLGGLLAGLALAGSAGQGGVPAGCVAPQPARQAQVSIEARAHLDGRSLASATLGGERVGRDEHWRGQQAGQAVRSLASEFVRVTGSAWLRLRDGSWQAVRPPADPAGGDATLDSRVVAVLRNRQLATAEDLGVERVGGLVMRRCRIALDGTTAVQAFLPLAWLIGGDVLSAGGMLDIWRGELDWWTDQNGQLRRVEVLVAGHPADAWQRSGLEGQLTAVMSVEVPPTPPRIEEPLP